MPAFRDIIVVLDDSTASEIRLELAVAIAQRHDAHLTGFSALGMLMPARPYMQPLTYSQVETLPASQMLNWSAGSLPASPQTSQQAAEKAERIEAAFRIRLRSSAVRGEWKMAGDNVSETLVRQARHADLTIFGQVDPNHPPPPRGRQLLEDVLMTSGRPVLVVPYIGRYETAGTKVLVGWNNSREAARAMSDAMPMLAKAESVMVLEATPAVRKATTDHDAGADVVRHLARHGINARSSRTVIVDISAADALLSHAADMSADLLVVGGYGHSRLRELILGGVTHGLLQHMTLPVLMSH